jgi:hypothetical protein
MMTTRDGVMKDLRRHLAAAWIVALLVSVVGVAFAAEWQHKKAPGTRDERAAYLLKDPAQNYPDDP